MTRFLLYLLFTLGGVSALIYEVTWMRSFRLVFGNSTRAGAVVLAAFFAGMAIGYLIGARLARGKNPVRVYGLAEIAVALSALLVLPAVAFYEEIYPSLYAWCDGNPGALTFLKLLLAGLALALPTIAMGITLPVLARAVVTEPGHVARRTGLLYALNIAGAIAGVLLAGFYLPLALGAANSIFLAAALNVFCGAIALLVARQWAIPPPSAADHAQPGTENQEPGTENREAGTGSPASALYLAAAISGFGTLALEVVYLRILSHRTESSVYSFALMLVIFLVFLGAASAWVSVKLDRVDPWRFLARTQLYAVVAILLSPVLFEYIPLFGLYSPGDTLVRRLVKHGIGSAIVLGPAILLVGVVLPATWKMATSDAAGVGGHVGRLTAINTIAAVAGSLVAGFVLIPWLGASGSVLPIAALYAALAVFAFGRGFEGIPRLAGASACIAFIVAWAALPFWRWNFQPIREGQTLLRYKDGESASIAVLEMENGHRVLKMNHEYTLGSSTAGDREIRQAHLPLLLHPDPKRVAFIGVATGMTASGIEEFPVEKVVAMEIIPGVVDALPDFALWNRDFAEDPRVEIVVADGRNHLLGTPEEFDVIISDLFVPWHAGTGDLYTVEHFKLCRDRLAEGGIFAQWLAGYQLTVEELRSISASFLEAFPNATLWRNDFHPDRPLIALIGFREPLALDPAAMARGSERIATSRMPFTKMLQSPAGAAMLYVSGSEALRDWARDAPLNTDQRPFIEFSTPHSFYRHKQRMVGELLDFLGGFRPREWPFENWVDADHSPEEIFRAADLMHDAQVAASRNNFEKEFRYISELIDTAGDVPGVAENVFGVANRYRTRNMTDRSEALLAKLVDRPEPLGPALLLLAQAKQMDGAHEEAIVLFERAAALAPEAPGLLRPLVDLLTSEGRHAEAEPHLRALVASSPDDARLRLDLARALDAQGKKDDAAEVIEEFRQLDLGDQRKELWRYLRTLGLGSYIDGEAPK